MSKPNSEKLQLILIIAIPLFGLLAMTGYYFYVTQSNLSLNTHNHGTLISPPKQIADIKLFEKGNETRLTDGSNKWTFLLVGTGHCDEACKQNLYLTRQYRETLGKYSLRINNVFLNLDKDMSAATAELFQGDYAGHRVISSNGEQAKAWFNSQAPKLDLLNTAQFYIVDPNGWVMMYYTTEQTYKQINKDMKFLLKNS